MGELKVLTLAGLGAFVVSAVTLAPFDCVTACASASGDPDPACVSMCDTVLGYRAPPVGVFLLVPLVAVASFWHATAARDRAVTGAATEVVASVTGSPRDVTATRCAGPEAPPRAGTRVTDHGQGIQAPYGES